MVRENSFSFVGRISLHARQRNTFEQVLGFSTSRWPSIPHSGQGSWSKCSGSMFYGLAPSGKHYVPNTFHFWCLPISVGPVAS
jgi:hypothetical protein